MLPRKPYQPHCQIQNITGRNPHLQQTIAPTLKTNSCLTKPRWFKTVRDARNTTHTANGHIIAAFDSSRSLRLRILTRRTQSIRKEHYCTRLQDAYIIVDVDHVKVRCSHKSSRMVLHIHIHYTSLSSSDIGEVSPHALYWNHIYSFQDGKYNHGYNRSVRRSSRKHPIRSG